MVLDERGGWYLIGSPCPQQLLHTVSLTLSHPHNLHIVSPHHHPLPYIFPPSLICAIMEWCTAIFFLYSSLDILLASSTLAVEIHIKLHALILL